MVDSANTVTIRYFAGARAAAGTESDVLTVDGPTPLGVLIEQLAALHGPALERILEASSFLVDETTGGRGRTVGTGSVVDVLPPFAGG